MSYIIAYSRSSYKSSYEKIAKKTGKNFVEISNKLDLNLDNLKTLDPKYIFFPHWSYKIPSEIYKNFNCVIFHMTDLPYGRGGSPLQNLIIRGHSETMVSAIKCVAEFDAGPVYLKKKLSLEGKADTIYMRAYQIIEKMIFEILETNPKPKPQKGKVVNFFRRKEEDGNWSSAESLDKIYDYIRMMDAKGYPSSFIRIGNYKLEFSNASRRKDSIKAMVKIIEEKENE